MRFMPVLAIVALLTGTGAPAGEAAPAIKPAGPLAGLPSKAAGPHVERLRAMPDDSWLNLGSPAADPVWGPRRGASWTPRMAYAAELRAAFVTGAGTHDISHQRNGEEHFDDDVFAYDINAHRWVCVYPGANCKTLKLKLDERRLEVDEQGNSVPVSFAMHGYNTYTYDPDRHTFVCMPNFGFGNKPIPQRSGWLGPPKPGKPLGNLDRGPKHPVIYDVNTGKLERRYVEGTGPGVRYWGREFFEGLVEYIPSRRQMFYLYFGEVWFYDPAGNRWIDQKTPGTPNSWGYDCTGCLDTRRERAYSGKGRTFIHYDVKANAWSRPEASKPPVDLNGGLGETMTYDSVNDVIVLNAYMGRRGVFFYSPAEDKWLSDKPRALPDGFTAQYRDQANAFYDPEFNAHYFFVAGDSQDNGVMWVYRYKKAVRQEVKP